MPFDNITAILKVYYFDEDLYLTALPLVKISMLLFYLRIFPQKWFRLSCFAAMACCAAYAIAFLLVSVFQCTPIHYAWNDWDGEHSGHCTDINAQGWSSAALNVILDIVVIGLPMPLIAKLQLNKRKKFLVFLMFSVGFVVTAVSILRLQVLVQFGGSTNFTCECQNRVRAPHGQCRLLTARRALSGNWILEYSRGRPRRDMCLHAGSAGIDHVGAAQIDGRKHACKLSRPLRIRELWQGTARAVV